MVEAQKVVAAAKARVESEAYDVVLAEADELVIQFEKAQEIAGTLGARLYPLEIKKPLIPRLERAIGKINIGHNSPEYHESKRASGVWEAFSKALTMNAAAELRF